MEASSGALSDAGENADENGQKGLDRSADVEGFGVQNHGRRSQRVRRPVALSDYDPKHPRMLAESDYQSGFGPSPAAVALLTEKRRKFRLWPKLFLAAFLVMAVWGFKVVLQYTPAQTPISEADTTAGIPQAEPVENAVPAIPTKSLIMDAAEQFIQTGPLPEPRRHPAR